MKNDQPSSASRSDAGIYVASRVKHADMWKRHRSEGSPIISTWIDEAGEGETPDFGDLWQRIREEIASCRALVFYGTAEDAPWKGALVEVGMALAMGKHVYLVYQGELDGRTQRPLGSWILDRNVIRVPFVEVALWRVGADSIAAPRSEQGALPKPDAVALIGKKSLQLSYFGKVTPAEAGAAFKRWIE